MRDKPINCQIEPNFPGLETVICSFRDPEWVCHNKMFDCKKEYPHKINECLMFDHDA